MRRTFKDLEHVLNTIQSNTQPCTGHTDPNSINDCWNDVFEIVEEIKTDNILAMNSDYACVEYVIKGYSEHGIKEEYLKSYEALGEWIFKHFNRIQIIDIKKSNL